MVEPGQKGERGKPGQPGQGQAGGRGGEGGRGGAGEPVGAGGAGGGGGEGARGAQGPRGERGPTNRRALIGYLILTAGVVFALIRAEQIDNKQSRTLREIICLSAQNSQTSRQRTPAEKERSERLLGQILEIIDAEPCE